VVALGTRNIRCVFGAELLPLHLIIAVCETALLYYYSLGVSTAMPKCREL